MQNREILTPPLSLAEPVPDPHHEIDGVCRGVGLEFKGINLVGEGMGIGGVIGLAGRKAVFPLQAETVKHRESLKKTFHLNGLSIKFIGTLEIEKPYKMLRSILSPLYMEYRSFRPLYTILMSGRTLLGVKSRYLRISTLAEVDAKYELDGGSITVETSVSSEKAVKILIANELSGRLFTKMEMDGVERSIPPWLEVWRPVTLHAPSLGLSMTMEPVDSCRMFVGREVLGRRLDWAGVSYQLPDGMTKMDYRVSFKW